MTDASLPDEAPRTPPASVTISEFRARLAEMVGRAERGEEVVIARGREPVAKLIPLRRRRRLGVLKDMSSAQELAALTEAVEKPLSPNDRAALEGEGTDVFGISRRRSR